MADVTTMRREVTPVASEVVGPALSTLHCTTGWIETTDPVRRI
jgi:hypothetical protein